MKAALSSLALAFSLVAAGCSGSGSGTTDSSGGSGGKSSTGNSSGGGSTSTQTSGGGGATATSKVGGSSGGNSSSESHGGSSVGGTAGGSSAIGGGGSGGSGTSGGGTGGASSRAGNGGSATGGAGTTGGAGSGGTSAASGGTSSGSSATGGSSLGGTTGSGGTGGSSASASMIGATPPMGWNSWNKFACGNDFNEKSIREIADAFVTSGMKDAGYQYVNLDDCWMSGRDATTKKIKVNTTRFPSGIAALAEYVHGKGLKIGLYSTPNDLTCTGVYGKDPSCVGSKNYETIDAQTYAEWGIDYLKYDKCQGDLSRFAVMRDALRATKRDIFYSINPGDQGPFCVPTKCSIDLVKVANMWRIEMDIGPNWESVLRLVDANKGEYIGAGPGHWNDPDMLEVGNYGLSDTEGRAHFSMWVIMAAPLITGNDVRSMTPTTTAILTNKEAIALNQDPLGKQGRVVASPGANLEVWSKELSGTNARGVALFNRGTGNANITVKWSDLGLPAGPASVRDIWAAKDVGPATDSYTATNVAGHSVVLLKIVSGG